MEAQKQIAILKKQNDGMESGFKSKEIQFNKLSIDNNMDQETELMILKTYNEYLKGISKQNRPIPQEKVKEEPKPNEQPNKPKAKKDDDNEDDHDIKEVKPVYSTITNMEDIKRAFFSREYESASTLIKQQPFKFYEATYKFSSDNTGRPSFVAKNLLRGFTQGLDDYRKYFMICFRCILVNKETNEYNYPSYWVVNTNDELKTILGSLYGDYDFIEVNEEENINNMLRKMEKNEDENNDTLIGEVYLH